MIQYKSINHQDTSLAEREEYFKNLEHKDDDSAVLLQTCNRVELYYGNGDVPDEVAPQSAPRNCRLVCTSYLRVHCR